MNMQDCKSYFLLKLLMPAMLFLFVSSCKKETEYIYEVDPVTSRKDEINKGIPKSTVEFISIAYADLFGETIPQNSLGKLTLLYLSFGDKFLIEDMLIKNMLNSPSVSLPDDQSMRSDIPLFVKNAYLKLYNREPNELEAFTLQKFISDDTQITPELVYYSMMTSDEYRYY